MSVIEAEKLQFKLGCQYDRITKQFQELRDSTWKSLKRRKKEVKEILNSILENSALEPVYTDLKFKNPQFRHRVFELAESKTVDEVMFVVGQYSSFFSYHLIEQIIFSLGTDKDKRNLTEYEEDFEKYAVCNCI